MYIHFKDILHKVWDNMDTYVTRKKITILCFKKINEKEIEHWDLIPNGHFILQLLLSSDIELLKAKC